MWKRRMESVLCENRRMSQAEQFKELMDSIKYGTDKIKKKVWNLAEYYNYMADFFDYIELPNDEEEHRALASKWEIENR